MFVVFSPASEAQELATPDSIAGATSSSLLGPMEDEQMSIAPAQPMERVPVLRPVLEEKDFVRSLVESVSTAIENRLRLESALADIRLEVVSGDGIDARKLKRVFAPRLESTLRRRGKAKPNPRALLLAQVVVSVKNQRFYVVTTLEGGALLGPSVVVVSMEHSVTLERALGGGLARGSTQFSLRRVGRLPAGVLDIHLVDVQGDFVDELVVLSLEGVTLYQLLSSTTEWQKMEHHAFPIAKNRPKPMWPRLLSGWLADDGAGKIYGATTAGHTFEYEPARHRITSSKPEVVPISQPRYPIQFPPAQGARKRVTLLWSFMNRGNPSVRLRRPDNLRGRVAAFSKRLRDVQNWQGPQPLHWVWVDENGVLSAQFGAKKSTRPIAEKVGDRFLLADFDVDGQVEALVTSSSGPGMPDAIQLISLQEDENQAPVFRQNFKEGSITAISQGDIDLDVTPDVLLVEEGQDDQAILWHLEYGP